MQKSIDKEQKASAKVIIRYNSEMHDLESICKYLENVSSQFIAFAVTEIKNV